MPDPRLSAILSQSRWQVRPARFVLVGLAPSERLVATRLLAGLTAPFAQLIFEPDVLTLVLPEANWQALSAAFPRARTQGPFRVISFNLDLPDDLVGFLAAVSRALADAGVPILAICGYAKDHVMVREEHVERALAAIQSLANAQA
jgi:hypothetical protein